MAAAVQSIREHGLYHTVGNASDAIFAETSLEGDMSLLSSKVVWGFSLLLVLVLARVFGSKSSLPAGTRALPKLPGQS